MQAGGRRFDPVWLHQRYERRGDLSGGDERSSDFGTIGAEMDDPRDETDFAGRLRLVIMFFDIVKKGFDSSVPWRGARAICMGLGAWRGGPDRAPSPRVGKERQILATGLSNAVRHRSLTTDY